MKRKPIGYMVKYRVIARPDAPPAVVAYELKPVYAAQAGETTNG